MSGHIFLSYHHASDDGYLVRLAAHLTAAGVRVWFDREIVTGDRWEHVIRAQLADCSALLVVMTPGADESSWVKREITEAEELGKPIFPLLLAGRRFFRLSDLQYEDVSGGRMPGVAFIGRLVAIYEEGRRRPSATLDRPAGGVPATAAQPGAADPRVPSPDPGEGVALAEPASDRAAPSALVFVMFRIPAAVHQRQRLVGPGGMHGSLGSSMASAMTEWRGVSVGWSPESADTGPVRPADGPAVVGISITPQERELYYDGYCGSTIWPLYHDALEAPEFRPEWRDMNRVVNERFAEAVARVAAPGAAVWVHDYQLQLVPGLLRRLRPDLRIGFFLHIPFPPVEMFLRLPDREDVMRGLLGADLVGFQSQQAVRNFGQLAADLLGLRTVQNTINVDGRAVRVLAFPVSVDFELMRRRAGSPGVQRRAQTIRRDLGAKTLLLSLDRLDYTKGIEQHLRAYGDLLHDGLLDAGSTIFVQLVTPSREGIGHYSRLRDRIDQLVGHLNSSFGQVGRPVIQHAQKAVDVDEIAAWYVAADVMVVTPFRDGMNLVAKEYVSSRADHRGVLVLSEFAGAARELDQALLVNPYDLESIKRAIVRAVGMPLSEQAQRMIAMRRQVESHDFRSWITAFMEQLMRTDVRAPA